MELSVVVVVQPSRTNMTTLFGREGVKVNPMDIDEIHRMLTPPNACNETHKDHALAVVCDPARRFMQSNTNSRGDH